MKDTFDHIDDLIGKVLAGEATAAEREEVDAWLMEDEQNKTYFIHLETIFEKAANQSVQQFFDTDTAWRKVKSRMNQVNSHSKPGSRQRTLSFTLMRIAAGIAIMAAIGYGVYRLGSQPIQTRQLISQATTVHDTLPDGSTAFMNKKSEIRFEYDPNHNTRKVKLTGEAYFEVKHEEEKPFIIETGEVLIKDLGTAFNVKSYPENQMVEVIVERGEVHMYTLRNAGVDLVAGEKGIYDKKSKEFSKIVKSDTNGLAYKTRVFSFNNTDLESVVDLVNEVYGSNIRLGNESLNKCHVTVGFNNESIDIIIEILSETLDLKVTRTKDEIILDGRGCR